MNGSKFRAMLLLVLTFAAGTAAGVAADRFHLLPGTARAEETTASGEERREGRRERQTTIERFADDLGLSAEQRAEIDEILDHYRASVRFLWSEVRPRYRTVIDSARTQIEAVLTPEQVIDYRVLLEERSSRREGNRDQGDRAREGDEPTREDSEDDDATSDATSR